MGQLVVSKSISFFLIFLTGKLCIRVVNPIIIVHTSYFISHRGWEFPLVIYVTTTQDERYILDKYK